MGTKYHSTDTDRVRIDRVAPLGSRVDGLTRCRSCHEVIGPLEMWCPCEGRGDLRAAEQARNSPVLALR